MARLPAPKTWDEYRSGVLEWLNTQWGPHRQCPYCGNDGWNIGAVLVLKKPGHWPDKGAGPNVIFPQAPVTCTKCGHTVFIDALTIFMPQSGTEV